MPNNYLSVLYKHIIQVENKNVGLKVGRGGGRGTNIPLPLHPVKKMGATCPPCPPQLPTPVYIHHTSINLYLYICTHTHTHIYIYIYHWRRKRGGGGGGGGKGGMCPPLF